MAMTPQRQHIAILVEQDEQERQERYRAAWDAYENGCPHKDPDNQDNIRLGYPRLIVDKSVSFLAGKGGVTLQVMPREIEQDDPETAPVEDQTDDGLSAKELQQQQTAKVQAALEAAWPGVHLDFHNLAVNGGVAGHCWLRLYEPTDGGPPRVTVLDTGNVTAVWNEDDVTIVDEYRIEWTTIDRDTGEGVARRKRIVPTRPGDDAHNQPTSWTIFDEEDDGQGGWVPIDETPWEHVFPPIFGGQNLPSPNTFYGAADLEPEVLDMVDQLQSLASDMRKIVRLSGHPVPVIFGEDASRLSELEVEIGSVLAVPNDKARLDQLQIAELSSLLELYRELKTALFETAHIPKVAIGETTNSGPTAGVALQVEYAPLIERTETKRLTYGQVLTSTADAILDLIGHGDYQATLAWPDLLPHDDQADALQDEAEIRMGIVSKQTIAEKRGYDWSTERDRIAEEKRECLERAQEAFDAGNLGNPYGPGRDAPPEE